MMKIYRTMLAGFMAASLLAVAMVAPATAKDKDHRGPPVYGHRVAPPPKPVPRGQWWDGAHGHGHVYPVTGWRVHDLPPRVRYVVWGGVRYGYWDGIWYAPYGSAFVVARPPIGVVVTDLPAFRTVVTIGGIAYLYANGVYYRERPDGYEVVPSPIVGGSEGGAQRSYVYPSLNQSAEKQASDEYECHRWAVDQTGFDPSTSATGQAGGGTGSRGDYARAQRACLEGRGYTVR
jgi:hypothetical protein